MTIFWSALVAWLLLGYVVIALSLGGGYVYQDDFPEYGLEPGTEGFLWPLVCVLLWPYTLWRARDCPSDGDG